MEAKLGKLPKMVRFSSVMLVVALAATGTPQGEKDSTPSAAKRSATIQEANESKREILKSLKSPDLSTRMAAMHQLAGQDRSFPFLKDSEIRSSITDLLVRETSVGKDYNTAENTHFQYYEAFLEQCVEKIAQDYDTPEAWRALVYSDYAAESPIGDWIAKQSQSFPLLVAWVDDPDYNKRLQALWMLGEVCALDAPLCPKVLPILRQRIASADTWTQQGAMMGIGICGDATDIALLRKLPACSSQWNVKALCAIIGEKIAERLSKKKEKVSANSK